MRGLPPSDARLLVTQARRRTQCDRNSRSTKSN